MHPNPPSIRFADAQHMHKNRWLRIFKLYTLLACSCLKLENELNKNTIT